MKLQITVGIIMLYMTILMIVMSTLLLSMFLTSLIVNDWLFTFTSMKSALFFGLGISLGFEIYTLYKDWEGFVITATN